MADNVVANAGAGGATFATDDIAGVHYPMSKMVFGALDTATLVTASVGLPVADAGGSLTVDNAALAVVGGGVEATALRVTIANDSTGVVSIDDNAGSITVDGTVTANLAAGINNIGDVDVVTVPAPLSTTGGGTEATALRVTLASDSTGVLSVDDNGGTLTVDNGGTFAVQETGTATTIFRSIDLDETEEEVKATAGTVYGMWVTNTATATRFIKFYNATAATVVVGTTTPVITIGIPGNATDDIAGNFGPGGLGIAFSTAITVAATTGVADADTGAPGVNEVIVNIFYK